MKFLPGISTLAPAYDAFILDLWGVIHDGQALYPGVKETLSHLRDADKKIIFLSNAPRRAAKVKAVLDRLGVHETYYDHIVSSGEVAYHALAQEQRPMRYIYVGLQRDDDLVSDLGYMRVDDPGEAQFLLNAGLEYDEQSPQELLPLLKSCHAAGLPMMCINPDMEVVRLNGQKIWCAGALAKSYEQLGGKVSYYGKPYENVYDVCFNMLADVAPDRIFAVGDNLDTDILGAVSIGLPCALVAGGILKQTLHGPYSEEHLATYCRKYHHHPDVVIPGFLW